MPKSVRGEQNDTAPVAAELAAPPAASSAPVEGVAPEVADEAAVAEGEEPAWKALKVAVIDDAMHPARLARLTADDAAAVTTLLTSDAEVLAEMDSLGYAVGSDIDAQLVAVSEFEGPLVTVAKIGTASQEALRMIEEHRSFLNLKYLLEEEVAEVLVCDPFAALPNLADSNLILLDYFLEGSQGDGTLAIDIASQIKGQAGRSADQQIVLMSSMETVRALRGEFRANAGLAGSAFAFVGKLDLNEGWKVKAHLGMLGRARPYAPAFLDYRTKLDESLETARAELLALVDDLDIGDYAFLQSRALMKDGHPLGDYVFWLLSSQLIAFAFEREEMRERQRVLDGLEFVGAPFAATEPSTIVANLMHSALVSKDVGPLGPHPRAALHGNYANFPLAQLGDVFLDKARTKAVVVMSADCDLAFAPNADREPDGETPVMLVPGKPVKLKEPKDAAAAHTEGLVLREEVYRIVWDFGKYRSVPLEALKDWLEKGGFDVTNRDRLRPLFGLKLQQEFGAHLLRVGPPLLPPMTSPVTGKIYLCLPDRQEWMQLGASDLRLTRFKGETHLRITTKIASMLKSACEELLNRLEELHQAAAASAKTGIKLKLDALQKQIEDDPFWIGLIDGVDLNSAGSLKAVGPLSIVLGPDWTDPNKPRVVLEINENAADAGSAEVGSDQEAGATSAAYTETAINVDPAVGAVSEG